MKVKLDKQQIIEEATFNKTFYYVFGEIHSNMKDVKDIQKQVRKLKPDLIIAEIDWEEKIIYPEFKVIALEPSNDGKRKLPKDIKKSFKIREKEMVQVLKKYKNSGLKIAVIVGDTHIRESKEFFGDHPLQDFFKTVPSKIRRSIDPEIK